MLPLQKAIWSEQYGRVSHNLQVLVLPNTQDGVTVNNSMEANSHHSLVYRNLIDDRWPDLGGQVYRVWYAARLLPL